MMQRINRVLRGNSDDGQGLIVVLFITMLLMALVVTATTATAAQVVPSKRAIDDAAALAAAQGGVDDFIAAVNKNCLTPGSCAWIDTAARSSTALSGGRASLSWRVLNKSSYLADGFVRIESTGAVATGGSATTRTLVADVQGSPNLLDYLFYTRYETQSAASVAAQYPARSIPITGALSGLDFTPAATLTAGQTVHWDGAGTSTRYPAVSACDREWYDTDTAGRNSARFTAGLSDPANAGIDWGEKGTIGATPLTDRPGACEVSFSSVSTMNGKVYSDDALLVSSSVPGGSGPTFRDTVETGWSKTATPAADLSRTFRTFPQLPGSAPALGSRLPQTAVARPVLPVWDQASAEAAARCVYTGPTRIRVVGATVIVTSPLTAANGANPCFASQPSTPGATGPLVNGNPSVLEARYPYAGITIAVRDAAAATPATVRAPQSAATSRTAANSLFRSTGVAATSTPVTAAQVPYAIGTWTPLWNATTNLQSRFVSEVQAVAAFQTTTQTKLEAANTATKTLTVALGEALKDAFNGKDAITGTALSQAGRSYTTTVSAVTSVGPNRVGGTTSYAAGAGTTTDHLLSGSEAKTPFVDTTVETVTATVARQPQKCTILNTVGALCLGEWKTDGVAVDQFTVTATRTITKNGNVTVAVSAFPIVSDRTGYSTTAGDAYIEGTVTGALSVAAQSDVVVTGDVRQSTGATPTVPITEVPYFTSTDGVVLAAKKNVNIYHPVSCVSANSAAIAASTDGFCPDDLTGLYVGGMTPATFAAAHPSRQYANADAAVSRIDAAVFALGGSLALMNYDRGPTLGTLAVNGGVYQEHHGVTGVEWEITTNSGVTTRPQSGYGLRYLHDKSLALKTLPWTPTAVGAVAGRIWNLQGTSERKTP